MDKCKTDEKDWSAKIFYNDKNAYEKLQNMKFEQGLKLLKRYAVEEKSLSNIESSIEKEFQDYFGKMIANLNPYEDEETIISSVNNSIAHFFNRKAIQLTSNKREEVQSKISVYECELLSVLFKKYKTVIKEYGFVAQYKNKVWFEVDEFHISQVNIEKYLTNLKNNNIISSFNILENGEGYVKFEDMVTDEIIRETMNESASRKEQRLMNF